MCITLHFISLKKFHGEKVSYSQFSFLFSCDLIAAKFGILRYNTFRILHVFQTVQWVSIAYYSSLVHPQKLLWMLVFWNEFFAFFNRRILLLNKAKLYTKIVVSITLSNNRVRQWYSQQQFFIVKSNKHVSN